MEQTRNSLPKSSLKLGDFSKQKTQSSHKKTSSQPHWHYKAKESLDSRLTGSA